VTPWRDRDLKVEGGKMIWINVKDKVPPKGNPWANHVLLCYKDTLKQLYMCVAYYDKDGWNPVGSDGDDIENSFSDEDVIAWARLPEPPEEG